MMLKRLILVGSFLLYIGGAYASDVKFSALPVASSVGGTDITAIVQSATSKQASMSLVAAYAFSLLSQDCTATSGGVLTCTKTNNVAFANSATTDTTNAANISSGSLPLARMGGSAASHAVVVDVAGTGTWKVIPDCLDTAGNHLNYAQSTDVFSCGNSGGGGSSIFPAYVSSQWMIPYGVTSFATNSAVQSGTIRCFPGLVVNSLTISALGAKVSTLSIGGNFQLAVYANSAANKPTGNALASTASISTTLAQAVNGTASATLAAGMYWWCANHDNATSQLLAVGNANGAFAALIGSATQGNDVASTTAMITGVSVAQTYGTWPDLTLASFAEVTSASGIGLVQFKVN